MHPETIYVPRSYIYTVSNIVDVSELTRRPFFLNSADSFLFIVHVPDYNRLILPNPSLFLPGEEITRFKNLIHFESAVNFLLSRIIVRSYISSLLCCSPHDIEIIIDQNDKPVCRYINFSISHTSGLIAVAFSYSHLLGVDVERKYPFPEYQHVASSFFPPDFYRFYLSLNSEDLLHSFYITWTLLESISKIDGIGLFAPLSHSDSCIAYTLRFDSIPFLGSIAFPSISVFSSI